MVGEAAAGRQQSVASGCSQDGRRYLCRDDGADDIDVVGGPETLDAGVENLARVGQGGVVHDDPGGRPGR
jgi:hypothetical protein